MIGYQNRTNSLFNSSQSMHSALLAASTHRQLIRFSLAEVSEEQHRYSLVDNRIAYEFQSLP